MTIPDRSEWSWEKTSWFENPWKPFGQVSGSNRTEQWLSVGLFWWLWSVKSKGMADPKHFVIILLLKCLSCYEVCFCKLLFLPHHPALQCLCCTSSVPIPPVVRQVVWRLETCMVLSWLPGCWVEPSVVHEPWFLHSCRDQPCHRRAFRDELLQDVGHSLPSPWQAWGIAKAWVLL